MGALVQAAGDLGVLRFLEVLKRLLVWWLLMTIKMLRAFPLGRILRGWGLSLMLLPLGRILFHQFLMVMIFLVMAICRELQWLHRMLQGLLLYYWRKIPLTLMSRLSIY